MDVQKLFDSMTLEEKCGQMTQICFGIIQSHSLFSSSSIDEKKLVNAIRDNGVGSIFHLPNISAESAKNSQKIIKRVQDVALNETRARIPILYGIDSIHGANFIQEAVLFPQPLNQAATFNRDVARRVGEITALETRAVGIPWNFNPVLDIGRQPLWPRFDTLFIFDSKINKLLVIFSFKFYF